MLAKRCGDETGQTTCSNSVHNFPRNSFGKSSPSGIYMPPEGGTPAFKLLVEGKLEGTERQISKHCGSITHI